MCPVWRRNPSSIICFQLSRFSAALRELTFWLPSCHRRYAFQALSSPIFLAVNTFRPTPNHPLEIIFPVNICEGGCLPFPHGFQQFYLSAAKLSSRDPHPDMEPGGRRSPVGRARDSWLGSCRFIPRACYLLAGSVRPVETEVMVSLLCLCVLQDVKLSVLGPVLEIGYLLTMTLRNQTNNHPEIGDLG